MCTIAGELFKLGMVHEAIIHSCIKEVSNKYPTIVGVLIFEKQYQTMVCTYIRYWYICTCVRSTAPSHCEITFFEYTHVQLTST